MHWKTEQCKTQDIGISVAPKALDKDVWSNYYCIAYTEGDMKQGEKEDGKEKITRVILCFMDVWDHVHRLCAATPACLPPAPTFQARVERGNNEPDQHCRLDAVIDNDCQSRGGFWGFMFSVSIDAAQDWTVISYDFSAQAWLGVWRVAVKGGGGVQSYSLASPSALWPFAVNSSLFFSMWSDACGGISDMVQVWLGGKVHAPWQPWVFLVGCPSEDPPLSF